MSQPEGYAAKIIADAESLLAKVQSDLDESAEFYRSTGIKPEKVLSACEPYLGPKEKEELNRIVKADQEAIQREVDEAAARASFSAPATGGARKPRSMV
jgi:hypothetical protein